MIFFRHFFLLGIKWLVKCYRGCFDWDQFFDEIQKRLLLFS
jgi:hypothetical protein